MKNPRFTDYNTYPYDHIVRRAMEKELITRKDGLLIVNYIEDKLSKGNIEEARAQRLATILTQWRKYIPVPYNEMTYQDLLKGVAAIRKGKSMYDRPYSPDTVRQHIKAIKTFTKYLARHEIVKITRDDLDEIKYPKEITESIKSKDILTDDQVELLIGAVKKIRNKAIIGTLKDTGLRPVDLAGLKWKDLEFNQRRVKISVVADKTNVHIDCFVILHKSWLVELRKQHNNASDDDYVFVDDQGEPLQYVAIDRMLKRAGERCGVKFPRGATAKLFRATSITEKQRAHYSPAAVSMLHFGTRDSKMMRHYSKFSRDDVEREALEIQGAQPPEPVEITRPDLCPVCNEPISPGVKFCPECGKPLTKAAAEGQKDLIAIIQNTPEYKEILKRLENLEDESKIK